MDVDNTPTRVEELWFSDGGLVVQAEQSLFRISGGILAARSPVFKDMLVFPQPPDAETVEGCPVVRLPDSATDIIAFFKAIFDSSFFEPHPSPTELDLVISILHLSNKYAVDYLKRRALVHLSHRYATTLSEYDGPSLDTTPDDDAQTAPYEVAAILIAREVAALWILPMAFYYLASTEDAAIQAVLDCVTYKTHPAKLSEDDRILFLKSSLHVRCQGQGLMRFLYSPHIIPGCQGGQGCTAGRLRGIDQAQTIMEKYNDDPLALEEASLWSTLKDGCCRACYRTFKRTHQKAREAFWDELPQLCGLPPWEELEKMKAEALTV
ncbi:hypothetical protein B0H17DRAFT_1011877 [Mycena rosella]|uniref:BTB domain-containing protein n=1 Tax=Mycena rosella TaxID=1033263 RepID=A0AAD7DFC4_MYCRO|nr:hypothetical protein B0H17DRAFT_1011877 [Mycena rosella]